MTRILIVGHKGQLGRILYSFPSEHERLGIDLPEHDITNATVYRCLLERLADKFLHSHIASITFPLRNNYGLVLDDLIHILRDHKPPYDAEIKIEKNDRGLVGKFVKYQRKG